MFQGGGRKLSLFNTSTTNLLMSEAEKGEFHFDQTKSAKCLQKLSFTHGQTTKEVYEINVLGDRDRAYVIYRTYDELKGMHKKLKKEKDLKKLLPKLAKKNKSDDKNVETFNVLLADLLKEQKIKSNSAFIAFIQPTHEDSMEKLTVKVLAGEDLPAADLNGKSDPFCVVCLYDENKKRVTAEQRTPIIKETLTPIWDSDSTFTFVLGSHAKGVSISCRDWDRVSRNDQLGRINIPLDTIPYNTEAEWWFPLHQTKNNKEGTTGGCIKLSFFLQTTKMGGPELDVNTSVSEEEQQIQAEQREEREKRMKRKEARAVGKIHVRYHYRPPNMQWEGLLHVDVVECANLKAKDAGGTSDPYVVVRVDQQVHRTKKVSKDLNPVFNQGFSFFLPPKSIAPNHIVVTFSVYDHDRFSKNDIIGESEVVLTDEDLSQKVIDDWFVVCAPPKNPKKMSKKLGRDMAEQGWAPKLPLVLVPGFGSTSLEVREGWNKWLGTRAWLSIGKLTKEKMHTNRSSYDEPLPHPGPSDWDNEKRNRWVLHMGLDEKDGLSDPPRTKLRPVNGTAAITYLDPGPITSNLSYVMGPLVENLQALGYVDGDTLITAPYDWRVAPHRLEERDGFYSLLKERVTAMVRRTGSPVVLLGHSMGNRTIDYFLRFVQAQSGGQQWLDTHIHSWVAVGAPFLGASKAVRGLISGDALGLEAFITQHEALKFARGISTTGFLYPIGLNHYMGPSDSVTYLVDEQKKAIPIPFQELIGKAGAPQHLEWYKKYYEGNPLFGGSRPEDFTVLKPPPIKRLHAIYGINLETEKFYFFTTGKNVPYDIDETYNTPVPNHKVKNGYAYETPDTKQKIIEELTGQEGCRSGDGTVPYESLAYCERWSKHLEVTVDELEGAEHRKILNNRMFFKKLVEFAGEKKGEPSLINIPSCMATLIDDIVDL